MIHRSMTFWALLAGLLAFVARFYFPAFPLDQVSILNLILFALGLVGIIPTLRAHGLRGVLAAGILYSLPFWQLICGLLGFVIHFFAPAFPFDNTVILAFFLFVLGYFGIHPELRARGLR